MEDMKSSTSLTVEILEKFMFCYLCKKDFKEPKLLPCGHTFCLECIEREIRRNEENAPKCPACDVDIVIPSEGLNGLPLNVSIRSLKSASSLDMSKCAVCKLSGMDRASTHVCRTCRDSLCSECAVAHPKSTQTHNHVVIRLNRDGESDKKDVDFKLGCLQHHDQELCFYCMTCSMPICPSCKIVDDHTAHSCVDLSTILKEVKADITNSLKEIDLAYRSFASNITRLRSMRNDFDMQCNTGAEQVRERAATMHELVNKIESDTLLTLQDIRDKGNEQLDSWISATEGQVHVTHDAKTDAVSLVGKCHPVQILTVHKIVQKYLANTAGKVKEIRQSAKLAKWTEITVQGPVSADIEDAVRLAFGSVLATPSDCHRLVEIELDGPVNSLAVVTDHIIACSQKDKTLKIYSKSGELVDEFEKHGMTPCDIASHGTELYVANTDSDQIRVFNKENGRYIHKGHMSLGNDGITKGIKFVSLDPSGNVFVSYENGKRVNVYNKKKELTSVVSRERYHPAVYAGLHVATLGLYTLFQYNKSTDMWSPRHVAVSRNGTLFVASHQPAKVRALNPAGDELFTFNVAYPSGIAVDVFQNLIVAEGGIGGKLHLVSAGGEVLQGFILAGDEVIIRAITIDQDGNLLVAYSDSTGDKLVMSSYVYTMNMTNSH